MKKNNTKTVIIIGTFLAIIVAGVIIQKNIPTNTLKGLLPRLNDGEPSIVTDPYDISCYGSDAYGGDMLDNWYDMDYTVRWTAVKPDSHTPLILKWKGKHLDGLTTSPVIINYNFEEWYLSNKLQKGPFKAGLEAYDARNNSGEVKGMTDCDLAPGALFYIGSASVPGSTFVEITCEAKPKAGASTGKTVEWSAQLKKIVPENANVTYEWYGYGVQGLQGQTVNAQYSGRDNTKFFVIVLAHMEGTTTFSSAACGINLENQLNFQPEIQTQKKTDGTRALQYMTLQ